MNRLTLQDSLRLLLPLLQIVNLLEALKEVDHALVNVFEQLLEGRSFPAVEPSQAFEVTDFLIAALAAAAAATAGRVSALDNLLNLFDACLHIDSLLLVKKQLAFALPLGEDLVLVRVTVDGFSKVWLLFYQLLLDSDSTAASRSILLVTLIHSEVFDGIVDGPKEVSNRVAVMPTES